MFKIVQWILKAGIAGIVSLIILTAITTVYSHSGVHVTNGTGATDYKWESHQFRSNMAEGFSWLWMNGDGFNNSFEIADSESVDVLLMGSSHMEAVNVAKNRNVGFLLNESFAELTTYNIGISGHTIYQCVNNLPNAISYYNPEKYIIIETDRIDLDGKKMRSVLEDKMEHIPSHDSGLMYAVQKYIPCFLPLYRELGNWISSSISAVNAGKVNDENSIEIDIDEAYRETLNGFIKRISDTANGRQVIIFYHPETIIDDAGNFGEDEDIAAEFERVCGENGIMFVDMYDDFKELYNKKHKLAHGFINTAVGYGHLNNEGHRLVADRLANIIGALENGVE